ncbi:hypothetical protein ACHAXR_002073 [Thalassiosira sp. AJA248-18]
MVALLLSVALVLLTLHHPTGLAAAAASSSDSASSSGSTNDASNGGGDDEYESKIQQALSYHGAKSHQLLDRSLQEGGAVAAMEIGPDGNLASATTTSDDGTNAQELWQVEFALKALERELKILNEVKSGLNNLDDDESGDGGGDDYYSGDEDYYSGDDEEYDSGDEDYYSGDEEYYSGDDSDDYFSGDDVEYTTTALEKEIENLKDESLKAILDAITDQKYKRATYGDIKEEAETKADLDPNLWHEWRYWDLHAFFSCAKVFAQPRNVYDKEKWTDLRQFYHQFVKDDKEEYPIPEGQPERSYQFSTEYFDPPLEPFQAGEKGRGLKAARDISKGELVFKATNNTVIFTHGHTWRKFLFAVNERNGEGEMYDDETACDVLVWSWVQTLEEDGPLVIVADLDNGSLLNEGRDEPNWESPNVRCGQEGDERCMMEYYATKDIKKGNELLCDYREFALLDSWVRMGL